MPRPRTYKQVIQRLGKGMYHRYMAGESLYEGLTGIDLVSYIYDVPQLQVRADVYAVYEAHWPITEEPAVY
jgi:hypothetical protein